MEQEEAHATYRYRWVVLAAFMFVAALTQLMWLNYAPILSRTRELMGLSGEFPVVLLMLMFPLVYIPVSIPAGFIIDRKGFRCAVMIGASLTAAFSFLRLFADNYVLVLIGMIGISVGQPFVLNSITKMVATWFSTEESALASGLATLSLFVGMIVAQAVTQPLLEAFGNDLGALRMVVLAYSLAAAAGFAFFAAFGRAKPPTPPKRTEEEALGEEVAINMRSLRSLFGLSNFRILCLIIFVGNGSFVGLMQLIEDVMKPKGIGSDAAGFIGAVMVVSGVAGCVVLPAISDKLMRRKPFLLLAAAAAAPTLFLVGALDSTADIYVVGGFLGFFLLSALPVLLAFAEENTGAYLTGTATSMLFLLGNAGGVALTLVMEGIKAATGGENYFWAMVFLAALFVAAFAAGTRIREERARGGWTQRAEAGRERVRARMRMGRRGRKLAGAAAVTAAVFLILAGAVLAFLYSPLFGYPTDGEYPEPRIGELIWPTIGCPAMVVPGEVLEVEVDLREGKEPPGEEVAGWKASLVPTREELAGLEYELEPAGAAPGPSERWPGRDAEAGEAAVWLASFRVPANAMPELYDLRVEVEAGGERVSDAQPHAVAVVEEEDGDFTFVTLSDIHVHERGNSAPFSRQTDKGISESGDPLFFREAVRQVNLIHPDFVLMLGDYVRGQRRPGELATECERFYQELLALEVPAFLVPGNHDGYINGIDGRRWYEENIGPLHYSFDVGDCHFTCLDTYQWPRDDRVVMNKLAYMEPRRWQGQVLDAGDEADPSTYAGQLAWAEEDLAAYRDAALRVVALHHDPYSVGGEGRSYWNLSYLWGLYKVGGGGKGAEALRLLASRHRVHAVFGGHLHLDAVGSLPWEDGGGDTVYSCQTCVYFDAGGRSDHYPGYRLVEVKDGEIVSLSYLDGVSSYPFYDGSVLGGETDLDLLERPALYARAEVEEGSGEPRVVVEAENRLARPMALYVEVPAPVPPEGGYPVEGGEIYRSVALPARPGWVLLYLRTTRITGSGLES